jgi:hypothetical protein
MKGTVAVLDACVLYPAPLRSLLMYLATHALFRPRWTEAIHEEWMRNVRKDFPDINEEKLKRVRVLMDQHVPDALVVGYEPLIDTVVLPDVNDRHVLAAAIHAKASFVVTWNLVDFPPQTLAAHSIQATSPDSFICSLLDSEQEDFCRAAKVHRESLKRPALSVEDYLQSLRRQGLVRAVAELHQWRDSL